jgi:general L-amino acid transport system permease protein
MTAVNPASLPVKGGRIGRLIQWSREELFNTTPNSIISLICIYFLYKGAVLLIDWGLINAVWEANAASCKAASGACWGFVTEKYRFILFGTYPYEQQWRPLVAMLLLVGLVVISLWRVFWKPWLPLVWVFGLPIVGLLMWGGVFGLDYVENSLWGGLPLTLILSIIGTAAAFPLGILLALGRRSNLPLIRVWCVAFIELIRGVPLISVLFMASVMFPLFLPEGVTIDKLLRAQVGIILFTAAYLAEVFRGGLQAIPKGQYEAAEALGLSYWQSMRKIILPQALQLVIPPTVNSFISMFKDTSLILIVGLFDLLATTKSAITDPQWRPFYIEGYLFTAAIFFLFCYAMARYSANLERSLKQSQTH